MLDVRDLHVSYAGAVRALAGGTIELAGRSLIGLDPADVARAGLVQVSEVAGSSAG